MHIQNEISNQLTKLSCVPWSSQYPNVESGLPIYEFRIYTINEPKIENIFYIVADVYYVVRPMMVVSVLNMYTVIIP